MSVAHIASGEVSGVWQARCKVAMDFEAYDDERERGGAVIASVVENRAREVNNLSASLSYTINLSRRFVLW